MKTFWYRLTHVFWKMTADRERESNPAGRVGWT